MPIGKGINVFEQTFKNLDDTFRKDAGCSSELDYIEQTSWVLFLKYLDDFEKDKEAAAKLNGEKYTRIVSKEFSWTTWAAPKTADGKLDYNNALTGEDLKDFVDSKLFPYLKKFRADAESADTLQYKIGEIFHELKNKLQSGYTLREVVNRVDELRFRSNEEKHELSSLYEDKIKNMGNAGRNCDSLNCGKSFIDYMHTENTSEEIAELYEKFKTATLNLADEIEVKPQKKYIAFKTNKNIACFELQKKSLKIYIGAKVGTLDDSKGITTDVSQVGHFGTGDYQISVDSDKNLEYIMSLIKQVL